MTVKLIGIFKEKFDISDESSVNNDYLIENVITKDDFDNGTIDGYEGFFTTQEDTNSFIIRGEDHELPYDENSAHDNLTKEELELMDSLEEGDVIVFEADLYIDGYYGESQQINSLMTDISNIRKYEDKYAADEIRYIVSQMPTGYEEAEAAYNQIMDDIAKGLVK